MAQARAIQLVLAVYAAGFLLFWPGALLISDEAAYLGSAWAFAHGRTTEEVRDALSGEVRSERPGDYPPGTAALQAPLVALLGVRGAPVVSLLAWLLTGLLLLAWLERDGRSPLFALLFLGYLPALVLGRSAMSELPSALAVAASQFLLLRSGPAPGQPASTGGTFAAAFLGAASLTLRETNALFVAPLLVGAVLRREGRTPALLLGALLGLGLKLLASLLAFGDPFFLRPTWTGWSLSAAAAHLPLYLFALLVLAPLGLFGALAFRGPRRAEVVVTTALSVAFFAAWNYSGQTSGTLQRLVLGPRFFVPLLPLFSVTLAEALPRTWAQAGRPGGERLRELAARGWALAVLCGAAVVHPVLARLAGPQTEIAQALAAATSARGALVHDPVETGKYLAQWQAPRSPVALRDLPPEALPGLVARDGIAYLALLDRDDSPFHRARTVAGERWREGAARVCTLEIAHDALHGGLRLRVFRIERCP